MSIRSRFRLAGISVVLLLLNCGISRAAVGVSNINDPNTADFTADAVHVTTANSFTTGPGGPFTLVNVMLPMQVNNPTGATTILLLRVDQNGQPGDYVGGGDLGSQFAPQGETTLTFQPFAGPVTLYPNTTYWLSLGEQGSGNDQSWLGTDSTTTTGLAGWTIGTVLQSTNEGGTWFTNTNVPSSSALFTVNVTPEPASVSLLMLGAFAGLFRRRASATKLSRITMRGA